LRDHKTKRIIEEGHFTMIFDESISIRFPSFFFLSSFRLNAVEGDWYETDCTQTSLGFVIHTDEGELRPEEENQCSCFFAQRVGVKSSDLDE
jgi:hypothetical protein